ncbi:MAG: transposase [Christensenellales bacterium]
MKRKLQHNGQHLTLEQRRIIQTGIENRSNKVDIARTIGKDATTVSKEIRTHRVLKPHNTFNNRCLCIHLKECGKCQKKCGRYAEPACGGRDRSPGACNHCQSKACHLDKYYYDAQRAQDAYESISSSSRQGLNLTEERRLAIGAVIASLLKKGQSVYQIMISHGQEIGLSSRCLYNYIEMGVFKDFGVDNFSLKEVVNRRISHNKYKVRKEPAVYTYHKYEDYLAFCREAPQALTTEMDTVYNDVAGPFIQTFFFEGTGFMLGFLHQEKTSVSMAATLDMLQDRLGNELFRNLFSLLLTDRGSEFEKVSLFEKNSRTGEIRLNIFFCDPMQSAQKPHVENNHNFVRDIIPNGFPLTYLEQADLDLMFSHINSTPRKSLNGKTPYEVFSFLFGSDVARILNIVPIERDKVTLKPCLLHHVYKARK